MTCRCWSDKTDENYQLFELLISAVIRPNTVDLFHLIEQLHENDMFINRQLNAGLHMILHKACVCWFLFLSVYLEDIWAKRNPQSEKGCYSAKHKVDIERKKFIPLDEMNKSRQTFAHLIENHFRPNVLCPSNYNLNCLTLNFPFQMR